MRNVSVSLFSLKRLNSMGCFGFFNQMAILKFLFYYLKQFFIYCGAVFTGEVGG